MLTEFEQHVFNLSICIAKEAIVWTVMQFAGKDDHLFNEGRILAVGWI